MPGVSRQTLLGTDSEGTTSVEFIDLSESKCCFHTKWVLAGALVGGCLLGLMFTSHQWFAPSVTHSELSKKNNISFQSSKRSEKYYWPSVRGSVGSYLKSDYPGPIDISTPSWTWEYSCCPFCKWCTIPIGTTIDDQKNIFLTAADGIRKFGSTGDLLWRSRRVASEELSKNAVLMDGAAYTISQSGRAFAVNMDTGKDLWSTVVALNGSDTTYGAVNAHDGVVIVAANPVWYSATNAPGGSLTVIALNATNGKLLWEFTPDDMVWNFSPSFAGDGTFVYQDITGRAYRQIANTGTLVWKNGGIPGGWGDGYSNIGANGIVYATAGYGDPSKVPYLGALFAFSLSDGKFLWQRNVSVAPNSVPAVGILMGQTRPSVVIPTGYSSMIGPLDVHAFDAETGEDHWLFKGPYWVPQGTPKNIPAGGLSDWNITVMVQRNLNKVRLVTLPNAWAMPTIDGEGTVFVGDQAGDFWRLQDSDGNGKISGLQEVKVCKTDAAWVGSADAAIAPGMLTTTNVKSLLVWNY